MISFGWDFAGQPIQDCSRSRDYITVMVNQEIRQCQNCKQNFAIEPEDFDFYKKIEVPPPTFCPICRMQRRFAWRNERVLFRNICAKTEKSLISCFPKESGVPVYDRDVWWSDDWDSLQFGKEYDFSRNFFEQFAEFTKQVPQPALFNGLAVNSNYCNYVGEFKNAYLVSASWVGENVAYASRTNYCKDSWDTYATFQCELCSECVSVIKCFRTHYSQNCENCSDCYFCYDCKGCTDCIGCTNLRNQSYHIFNKKYSPEEYRKEKEKLKLYTRSGLSFVLDIFGKAKSISLRKYANIISSQNVTGDNVSHSVDSKFLFDATSDCKNCWYCQNVADHAYDCRDGYGIGAKCELLYEAFDSGVDGSKQCFCATVWGCQNAYYSWNCHGSSNLFGCIGVRNKEYCIFNRQYDKASFEEMRSRIVNQMREMPYMDKLGREYRYGEMFPIEISPYPYNATVASDYFPISRSEIESQGWLYREPELPTHTPTLSGSELPEDSASVSDSLLKEIISCVACHKVYRLIPMELDFSRKTNLPLSDKCPECRFLNRFKLRNPLKLWSRKCSCNSGGSLYHNSTEHFHGDSVCPNEFETTYSPGSQATIYCEQCYNSEIA